MDYDLAAKRAKVDEISGNSAMSKVTPSRFFSTGSPQSIPVRTSEARLSDSAPIPGPSHIYDLTCDKENEPDAVDNAALERFFDPVIQEDGYISPTPSYCRLDTPELSSPLRPLEVTRHVNENFDDFGADSVSSPIATKKGASWHSQGLSRANEDPFGDILVPESPPPPLDEDDPGVLSGPDLRGFLTAESFCEIELEEQSPSPATPISSGLATPDDTRQICDVAVDMVSDSDSEQAETEVLARVKRAEIVANGWWNKWALNKKPRTLPLQKLPTMKRRETTITPEGRQSGYRPRPESVPSRFRPPRLSDSNLGTRKSLMFLQESNEIELHNGTQPPSS
ncbi:hypothetical protein BJ138DRAFT_414056 [Hygrophoropsis aurantiaca]|uniref:Uncharacterized protein n=1 Tax=Hygrophoropsis aurantiaca TaxID=72124 RepID=A0ACB8A3A1_9AGAM|nr:hypothetical protein BJ138DRAFT_414056 [Hygrophoropsis aurantiaca]